MTTWPKFAFCDFAGPVHMVFAWYPVKLWYGRWIWLKHVSRRRVMKKSYLDGPPGEFWCYSDVPSSGKDS